MKTLNLFNALSELGIIALESEMQMVIDAIEKDKREAFETKAKEIAKGFSRDLLDRLFPPA